MARYFETAKAIVERHGGTVEKFIGDAVMAVFGVPVVHEDDALRAVRAADELRGGLGELNDELERDYGDAPRAAHGRQHGRGRHRHGGAARDRRRGQRRRAPRAGRARRARCSLGEETHRLVRDAVESEPVEPIPAKGKAEPLPAYRLRRRAGGRPGRRRHEAPMVGRRAPAEAARGRLRERRRRALVPPVHDARRRGRREVAARRGVPRVRSTARPSSAAAASRTARGSPTGR